MAAGGLEVFFLSLVPASSVDVIRRSWSGEIKYIFHMNSKDLSIWCDDFGAVTQ